MRFQSEKRERRKKREKETNGKRTLCENPIRTSVEVGGEDEADVRGAEGNQFVNESRKFVARDDDRERHVGSEGEGAARVEGLKEQTARSDIVDLKDDKEEEGK